MSDTIEVKYSGLYISCTGTLCLTITVPKIGCFCYEIVGVNIDGSLQLTEIV